MQVTKRCANGHHTLIFNINERIPKDYVETNKTLADWSIQLQTDTGWGFQLIGSTVVAKIDGSDVYNKYEQRSCGNGVTTLASGTKEITHDPDGSKKVRFECSYSQSSTSTWTPGNASLNGQLTLTTIPRATACPDLSGDIESTYNIALNPATTTFSHSLYVSFGDLTGYVNASGNLQSGEVKLTNKNINFTIPSSFYQQFSGKSGTGSFNLKTYNGNTLIGNKTAALKANCLESRCRPSISGTVKDSNTTTINLTGNSDKLIKSFSNAKLTLTLKATTSSGDTKSTISSRSIDGTTFSGTEVTINKANKKDFTVTVTNSRGFSTSKVISAIGGLINYFSPSMNVNFYRPQQTDANVKLTYNGSFFNQSFGNVANAITLKWYWKKTTDSGWTLGGNITPSLSGNTIGQATIDLGSNYDYQTNYRFKLETVDKLSNGNKEMNVTAGIPIYSHGKNWFQHHTDIYDKSTDKILSAKSIFPIGSVFITVVNTNPSSFLGGTWVAFGQGRTLVGVDSNDADFNSVLKTGGNKTVTLTVDQIPAHTHGQPNELRHEPTSTWWIGGEGGTNIKVGNFPTESAGGGKAHPNLQPYITVYFWRRTA